MTTPVAPGTRIGHVHLKVADLDRAIAFYSGVLGFELQQKYGSQAAFVSAGGYHHHIGLNTWESRGGTPPPPGHTGLYHTAILYPARGDLADALRRLIAAGVELDGASDHGVSEALYLRDPDGNGVELYWDRPQEEWPRDADGNLRMMTERLELAVAAGRGLSPQFRSTMQSAPRGGGGRRGRRPRCGFRGRPGRCRAGRPCPGAATGVADRLAGEESGIAVLEPADLALGAVALAVRGENDAPGADRRRRRGIRGACGSGLSDAGGLEAGFAGER